ncbi:HIT-like protein [Anaerohalosphaera lusitana]|uniref:HIT-like protein n=1 Tax=Anaerohalosphaera lusitana TaxID=1936003 RepID=A0A1U9NPQ9_9BACT|nr:HIT family protein [Anaerohalosphaera lusitana]AQT69825.1 HIT-like protein [Anaerohalosphaera lusitana]
MPDCIFCKIVKGEIPSNKLYEDEQVLAFLDIGPLSEGHSLVIPKDHFERFDQCPPDTLAKVIAAANKLAKAVAAATECDGYNVLCNTGRAAGQAVDHVHFHIIPRNQGDGLFDGWPAGEYEPGKAEKVADTIRKNL